MTTPVPVPDDEPIDESSARQRARDKMLLGVPDAVKALRELAASAQSEEIRLRAAETLLSYGIPVVKGGQRGDIL